MPHTIFGKDMELWPLLKTTPVDSYLKWTFLKSHGLHQIVLLVWVSIWSCMLLQLFTDIICFNQLSHISFFSVHTDY